MHNSELTLNGRLIGIASPLISLIRSPLLIGGKQKEGTFDQIVAHHDIAIGIQLKGRRRGPSIREKHRYAVNLIISPQPPLRPRPHDEFVNPHVSLDKGGEMRKDILDLSVS